MSTSYLPCPCTSTNFAISLLISFCSLLPVFIWFSFSLCLVRFIISRTIIKPLLYRNYYHASTHVNSSTYLCKWWMLLELKGKCVVYLIALPFVENKKWKYDKTVRWQQAGPTRQWGWGSVSEGLENSRAESILSTRDLTAHSQVLLSGMELRYLRTVIDLLLSTSLWLKTFQRFILIKTLCSFNKVY